jgi:hypothetical protein
MLKTKLSLSIVATLIVLFPQMASAQLARTFVSAAVGNDANACDRATPCRTFQVAHDRTFANGEITVLDPGGYGTVTINKTISIINDGVGEAGMLVSGGGTGVAISAAATDAVSLRGITIKGIGFGGGNGIVFNSGRSLTVENSVIRNLDGAGLGNGVIFRPNVAGSLGMFNTIVADNAANGISVEPTGAGITAGAVLSHVQVFNNAVNGIVVNGAGGTGSISASVADSVVANNGLVGQVGGVLATSSAGQAFVDVLVLRSLIANNPRFGVLANSSAALIRLGQSAITGNGAGNAISNSGIIQSYVDNYIDGNANGNGAPTPIARK